VPSRRSGGTTGVEDLGEARFLVERLSSDESRERLEIGGAALVALLLAGRCGLRAAPPEGPR